MCFAVYFFVFSVEFCAHIHHTDLIHKGFCFVFSIPLFFLSTFTKGIHSSQKQNEMRRRKQKPNLCTSFYMSIHFSCYKKMCEMQNERKKTIKNKSHTKWQSKKEKKNRKKITGNQAHIKQDSKAT